MRDIVDSLLLRLAKRNKGECKPPCRLCGEASEASDLCDDCVTKELSKHIDEEKAKFLTSRMTSSMIKLRNCNKVLDQIDEDLRKAKERLDAIK